MYKLLLLLIGLAGLFIILCLCTLPAVYGHSNTCANDYFARQNMPVTATHSHSKILGLFAWDHKITLKGTVTDSATQQAAISGYRQNCNGDFLNHDAKINVEAPVVVAPVIAPEPVAVAVSPYMLTAQIDESRRVTLSGYVPDETTREAIVNQASASYGQGNVTDLLEIAFGAPEYWGPTATNALQATLPLLEGRIEMVDSRVSVSGTVESDAQREGIRNSIDPVLGANYQSSYNIVSRVDIVAADTCQTDFNALMSNNVINFQSASAIVSNDSVGILDELNKIASGCPNARIMIAGHTDSSGDDSYNQQLSEDRAGAVLNYLVDHGANAEKYSAVGYGETSPVADNATPAGRAMNRRIEFTVDVTD